MNPLRISHLPTRRRLCLVAILRISVARGDAAVQATDRLAASAISTVNAFPEERTISLRDRASGHYTASAYFIAKSLVEVLWKLPFPIVFSIITYWMIGFRSSLGEHGGYVFVHGRVDHHLSWSHIGFTAYVGDLSSVFRIFLFTRFPSGGVEMD